MIAVAPSAKWVFGALLRLFMYLKMLAHALVSSWEATAAPRAKNFPVGEEVPEKKNSVKIVMFKH